MRLKWLTWIMLLGALPLAMGCTTTPAASTETDTAAAGDADAASGADSVDSAAGSDAATADADAAGSDVAGDPLPKLSDMEIGKFTEIKPGGATRCSRDTEFAFFVVRGKVDRLLLEFEGGGACWDTKTCSIGKALCKEDIKEDEAVIGGGAALAGIYDNSNPDNPFKDWHHVYVPYCTCDIHWGQNDQEYGEGDSEFTVMHRGATNARRVLDWVYANFEKPEKIFVTGCSAGAYGSLAWSPYVMQHYPTVPIVQMGDSGAGIITSTFLADSFPNWHALDTMPSWIPALAKDKIDLTKMTLGDIYHHVALTYPTQMMSQYNTMFDENQTFYFKAMGGTDNVAWNQQMLASVQKIMSSTPNFRAFIAQGQQHCILPFANFYTTESNGKKLTSWMKDAIDGKMPESVQCANCSTPTAP